MKKLFGLILLFALFSQVAFAQKSSGTQTVDLPAPVKKTFSTKYKLAKKVVWSEPEENRYRADMVMNDKKMAVVFNEEGKVVVTETVIPNTSLNKNAVKYIEENYPKFRISEVRKQDVQSKKADNTNVKISHFLVLMKKGKEVIEAEFDNKGNYIADKDKTPEAAVKKKSKKEKAEEGDEEEPKAKAKKKDKDEEEEEDEPKPAKKKAEPKKKSTDDEDEDAPAPAKKKVETKKKTTDDDEDEDAPAPAKKKEEPKKKVDTKKKTTDDDEDEDEPAPAKKKAEPKKKEPAKKEPAKKKKVEEEDEDE